MSKQMKELRSLAAPEKKAKLLELRKEMIKINAQVATGTVPKNPYQIKNSKKTIARILTIQRANEITQAIETAKKQKPLTSVRTKKEAKKE